MWKHLGSLIGVMFLSVAIPAHGEYVLSSGARGDIFTDDQRPATLHGVAGIGRQIDQHLLYLPSIHFDQ